MKSKILLPFLSAISVIALLLAGCPPTNGGGGDTAPQYKDIQLLGKTIEIIFDKDLKGTPDAAKITVKQGKTPLTYKINYDLSISSTDKKKLIITLKQSPTIGQTYTVILKAGAVTGANGKAAKAKTVNLEVTIPPVLSGSGNLGFQTNSSTVLTLSFDTALKSLDTDKIQVQAKAATPGVKFGDVPATLKLNKDDKTKIDITLKSPAISGTSYQVLVAKGGVVSAKNVANSAKLTSIVVKYSDKPVLDTTKPPYILGKKLIVTFNMNIDLLVAKKVKLSKAVDLEDFEDGISSPLTPATVVAKTNTLEITLPTSDTVVTENVYRLALEAGAVNKAGKADITNPAIKPTNLDINILAAPALDGSQAPYMVDRKIYVTFNSPISGLDTSKKIGVEVSIDDGKSFGASDELDATPTFSGTVLVLTLKSRTQGSIYKVTLPAGLILGRNRPLTGIFVLIKATAGSTLATGAKPVFQSKTVFHITFKANVNLLDTDAIEVRKDDTAVPTIGRSLAANGRTVVVTLAEEATSGSKWKVLFPVDTVLDTTSRNANSRAITTGEETFVDIYRPATKVQLKDFIQTEQGKGEAADFSPDQFDISQVSDMSGLFEGNTSFNGDISSWDVSHVTNMSDMFKGATAFNQVLESWNVDGDTVDIAEMFQGSGVTVANIPTWYVKIIPIKSAPYEQSKFYVLLSAGEITPFTFTKQPANMTGSFAIEPRSLPNGLSFSSSTGSISGTPDALYERATHTITFTGSGGFTGSKYTLTKELDIGVYKYRPRTKTALVANIATEVAAQGTESPNLNNIDVSGVKNFSGTFLNKSSFNGNVSKWDTSNATNMTYMFNYASVFNGDVSNWDTSKVKNMLYMFNNADAFAGDISGWDVSSVIDMHYMFANTRFFNQDISGWDVSQVTTMSQMFYKAVAFNNGGEVLNWGNKTGQVTTMKSMFVGAKTFNQNISGWDVSKVTNMSYMFYGATAFSHNLEAWGTHLWGRTVTKTDAFKNSGVKTKPSWYTGSLRRK